MIFVTAAVFLVVTRRRRKAAVIRDAGLRARADYEHQLTLAGDPHGIYGRFPPAHWAVMPVRALPPRW